MLEGHAGGQDKHSHYFRGVTVTPDETDERRNHRADHVIAPRGAPPPFKGPYLKARVSCVLEAKQLP